MSSQHHTWPLFNLCFANLLVFGHHDQVFLYYPCLFVHKIRVCSYTRMYVFSICAPWIQGRNLVIASPTPPLPLLYSYDQPFAFLDRFFHEIHISMFHLFSFVWFLLTESSSFYYWMLRSTNEYPGICRETHFYYKQIILMFKNQSVLSARLCYFKKKTEQQKLGPLFKNRNMLLELSPLI